ncbi:MAG: hypothetical protein PHU80_01075 [Kiritimatiellae bacterium]|nr:hypothetical protein [Kiritimatiellia bacterium]
MMFFKKSNLLLALVLFAGISAGQQVNVGLTLAYNVYVVGEPVLVQIEALNATRDLIEVGKPESPNHVLIEITKDGQYNAVKSFNDAPVAGVFELEPSQSLHRKVELDKWFSLLQEGKYVVRAVIVHAGMRYESSKKSFDIVPGIPLGEGVQMFVGRPDLRRNFRLVYWHRNQVDRLFIRIEDSPGARIWDTIDLGSMMRGMPPRLDISPEGEVTVVHRSTQDAFARTLLWSLPDVVEVIERNSLLDPEISATQRVKSLYGEMADEEPKEKKSWWKFW